MKVGFIMSINIMEITKASKFDFGTGKPAIEKQLQDILATEISGENNIRKIAKACYNIREEAAKTEGKIGISQWCDFVESKFGSRLKSGSARKLAQVYDTYNTTDEEKPVDVYHENAWAQWPIGKLIICVPLDGKKHTDAGRSFTKFLYWFGLSVNENTAKPYAEWQKKNANALEIIESAESRGDKQTADFARAQLTEEPPKPLEICDENTDAIIMMGFDTARQYTDSNLKDKVAAYIEQNLNTPEQKAAAEKKAKADAKKAEKTAEEKRQDAENALIAYLATMEESEKPVELSRALTVLQALAKQSDDEK